MAWAGNTHQQPLQGPRHPALLAAVIVAAGIIASDRLAWRPSAWLAITLAVLAIVCVLFVVRRGSGNLLHVLALAALMFSIGALRLSTEVCSRPAPALAQLMSSRQPVEITGELADSPRSRLSGWQVPLDIQSIRTRSGPMPLHARVLLTTLNSMNNLRHGDCVRLTARLRAPNVRRNPGGFDYADFLFRQGIDGLARPVGAVARCAEGSSWLSPPNMVEPARNWIRSVFTQYLGPTPRALILGFLIGETDQLPAGLYESVRNSGTLHLLAVSGANVWLIVGMALLVLRLFRIRRWPRTIVLLAIVFLFSFLTRNEPSVVRASIMVAAILIGRLLFRPVAALNAVGVAGAVILLVSPLQLFRPGFQLSFVAVIAIIIVSARTIRSPQPHRRRWRRMIAPVILSSIAATAATAPILAFHFGTVPIAALPANLIMIPIASAAAYLGVGLLGLSAVSASAAMLLARPASWTLQSFTIVAEFFARLPHAVLPWPEPSAWAVANFYLALILIVNWRRRYRWFRPAVYYAVILTLAFALRDLFTTNREDFIVVLPDAGQERAAAIGHPNGNLIWIADDPGIGADLRQWVVEPLLRITYPGLKSECELSWRRNDSLPPATVSHQSSDGGPRWTRYMSSPDEEEGFQRIWADQLVWKQGTLILLRDYPKPSTDLEWLPHPLRPTVVLPATGSDSYMRIFIDRLKPSEVIFYGANPWIRHPDEWLERWQAWYPETEFWSTPMHGGLTLGFSAAGITVQPTIANSLWQDPDLRLRPILLPPIKI